MWGGKAVRIWKLLFWSSFMISTNHDKANVNKWLRHFCWNISGTCVNCCHIWWTNGSGGEKSGLPHLHVHKPGWIRVTCEQKVRLGLSFRQCEHTHSSIRPFSFWRVSYDFAEAVKARCFWPAMSLGKLPQATPRLNQRSLVWSLQNT